MKKIRGNHHSGRPNIRETRFISFSFIYLSFSLNKNSSGKIGLTCVGYPLCGGLNVLLHIAVIFTMHRRRNLVIFYINFSCIKVFKGNTYCRFFQTLFCLSAHNVSFGILIRHIYGRVWPFLILVCLCVCVWV